MKKIYLAIAAAAMALGASAQLNVEVGSMQRIKLPEGMGVGSPVVSADGSFVVGIGGDGIVRVDLDTRRVTKVAEAEAPFELVISPDGSQVGWLDATFENKRRYVGVKTARADGKGGVQQVVKPSRKVNTGLSFSGNTISAVENGIRHKKSLDAVKNERLRPMASINYGHLDLTLGDRTVTLDPQGRGSYLWPQVSPDGTKVVYWLCGQGCFVCDIDGRNIRPLGEMRAARWCGNKMIVGMLDRDDGVRLLSSEIVLSDLDGNKMTLTDPSIIAIEPTATDDGRRIVFASDKAELYVINLKKK